MFDLELHKKQNRDRIVKGAISSWTNKKNGVYRWFEKERYSVEYCKKQIEYFKNIKLL
jgi:hypothetical protein